jgi:hypothetical protein
MLKINKNQFRVFLENNLKLGKVGFEDCAYDFDAFLAEAENKLTIGNSSYELSGHETTSGNPECYYFEDVEVFVIQDREAGNIIDEFESLELAQEALNEYEEEDKNDGNYTEDFYEIVKC